MNKLLSVADFPMGEQNFVPLFIILIIVAVLGAVALFVWPILENKFKKNDNKKDDESSEE